MNMEDTGHKVKGIAEIVAALADSQLPNVEALFVVSTLLDDIADEMMEASNES